MSAPRTLRPLGNDERALRRALWDGRAHPHPGEQERLLQALVVQRDGCWMWPGRTRKGRGRTSISLVGKRVELDVHRAVFVMMVGPVPPGHVVTQTCGNPRCARPDHLQLLSPRQLWERGVAAGRIRPLMGWLDGHGPRRAAA